MHSRRCIVWPRFESETRHENRFGFRRWDPGADPRRGVALLVGDRARRVDAMARALPDDVSRPRRALSGTVRHANADLRTLHRHLPRTAGRTVCISVHAMAA